jgi:allantoate deiminase
MSEESSEARAPGVVSNLRQTATEAAMEEPRPGEPTTPEGLQADPARLTAMIDAIAELGQDRDGGISRLAFTDAERQAHELVGSWLSDLGLHVWQDAIGNTLAELPGQDPNLPAIGTGSHLDSVPHGGRFDGIAGVVAAVETARLIVEGDLRLRHAIRVVAFAAEEGARFGEPCLGSKAVASGWSGRSLEQIRDADGVTAAEALRSVDLDPVKADTCRWESAEWAAFLELHIEQARVLEASKCRVGLVDMVSGSTRVEFSVQGHAQHSGGTPMWLRADALTAASEVVLAAERLAHDPRFRGARATVGRFDVFPNSITTIPGRVRFVLDMRDTDSDRQRRGASEIAKAVQQIAERRGVDCAFEVIADTSPTVLPVWLREITMASCEALGVPYRVMTSGAGHDSQIVNRLVPAAMLFVPSKAGLSHVPEEWTSATDLATGATVLLDSMQRLDHFLAELATDPSEEQRASSPGSSRPTIDSGAG